MPRVLILGLFAGLAGCGSLMGSLDELPAGPDVSAVEWPRLVDVPQAPEARLMAGAGEQATARLAQQRVRMDQRLAQSNAAEPVSDALVARGESNIARSGDAGPGVDEAGLLARAAEIRARTAADGVAVDESDLLARAALIRQRTSAPVVSSSFEERARLARERAAKVGI